MKQVISATRTLFTKRNYLWLFLAGIPTIFAIFVLVPVKTIPGNDLAFQLSIFALRDWIIMAALASLTSLLLVMNIYIFRQRRALAEAGKAGAGGVSSIVGAVFGTAACSSCVAALFGFMGLPFVLFLVEARLYIVFGAIGLILLSLYFASKKIVLACENC